MALAKAADTAAEVVLPLLSRLDAVVTGGDRQALQTVLADPRLLAVATVGDDPHPRCARPSGAGAAEQPSGESRDPSHACRNLNSRQ